MATTTVYASGDSGYVRCSDTGGNFLNSARGDASLTASEANTIALVGIFYDLASTFTTYEAFLKWDTSAVGTDIVSNVDFEVDGELDQSVTDYVIEGYVYDWGSTLTTADFRDSDSGIPALGSIISSYDTSGGWDVGVGYNNALGANAAFASAIDGSGDTEIVVISQEHRNESEPTTNERVSFQCTGATNDARLTITHAPSNIYSAIDDDPDSPDGTVIQATAS